MRCSEGQLGCGRRFRLSMAPHKFARAPRCPSCKSIHVRSVNAAAIAQKKRRKARGLICYCHNYPFPHVRGSMRFCAEHPRITKDYSDREWDAYQFVLATPRGGWSKSRLRATA